MGSNNCMNEVCRATTSSEWKKGWSLKSGGLATLCCSCGSAYENSIFCKTFHLEESGWRECRMCGKRIHCGCIASKNLHEYMDFGGVGCISCAKPKIHSMQSTPGDLLNATFSSNSTTDVHPVVDHRVDGDNFSTERFPCLTKGIGICDINFSLKQVKQDTTFLKNQESNQLPGFEKQSLSAFVKGENSILKQEVKDMYESLAQPSLGFSFATPVGSPSTVLPFHCGTAEGSKQSEGSFQPGKSTHPIFRNPPKPCPMSGSDMHKRTISQTQVGRPPTERRGRNQPLPRYWPRITDQELQQLSGNLKSTILPLFEKILSASDAGRIGRLVLPKACAEAYFPPIDQSEGIPIRIQDMKGKEWTFQFRFWPNNNSRMYVLEGVTPCIQNMQMQAGDTVTFSRSDPGGQLVIGCRKAINNIDEQDCQTPVIPKCDSPGESLADNLVTENGSRVPDDLVQNCKPTSEKKIKNIKNKRLRMNTDDALELRITWEEAQALLRPSPAAKSSAIMVEDHEFEEFDEPPIFGKRTIFTSQPSGEPEQLAQCDSCSKWRRLPVNALLFATWTCSENIWDSNRFSCSAPEDLNPRDLDSLLGVNKDYSKKQRISDEKSFKEGEPCGIAALETAAGKIVQIGESSTGATTRHPRHRPGCTCIVCIQPPSGKGNHKPTCECNVCSTVKRRFNTLMMRKKKRKSEREAELARVTGKTPADVGLEMEGIAVDAVPSLMNLARTESIMNAAAVVPLDMHVCQNGSEGVDLPAYFRELQL